MKAFLRSPAATCVVALRLISFRARDVRGELVLLATLARHGSRAPNAIMNELCPANEENLGSYHVPPGQLTEVGMKEARQLGEFIREVYVDALGFLPSALGTGHDRSFSSSLRSDASARCLQSAQAMAQGLYPNGTGPPGFPNQPVPVQTQPHKFDTLLANALGPCASRREADDEVFDMGRGQEMLTRGKSTIDIVTEACGVPLKDFQESYAKQREEDVHSEAASAVIGVKDLSDMFDFDDYQGLQSLSEITNEVKRDVADLAFQLLQERYYSTRQQVAYWSGDLPLELLNELRVASERHRRGRKPDRLYLSYHGHRELLYGVAHQLGWHFGVPGMPRGLATTTTAIPPGTAMFFELHQHSPEVEEEDPDDDYYVRTFTWTPRAGQQETVLDVCNTTEAGRGCPLSILSDDVTRRTIDVGLWEDICHFVPFDAAEATAQREAYKEEGSDKSGSKAAQRNLGTIAYFLPTAFAATTLVVLLAVLAIKTKYLLGQRSVNSYEPVA